MTGAVQDVNYIFQTLSTPRRWMLGRAKHPLAHAMGLDECHPL